MSQSRAATILVVVPTYGHFDYALKAVASALRNTRALEPHVLVVDDASPDRLSRDIHHPDDASYGRFQANLRELRYEFGEHRVRQAVFDTNGGLTRSWNCGLAHAKDTGHDFCCVTNSDVIFTPDWDYYVFKALDRSVVPAHLVGPLTNAPGASPRQYVGRYSVTYDKARGDDPAHMDMVAAELYHQQGGRYVDEHLNGFCLTALTATWWKHAYDEGHVFRPRNDFNSKGQRNPTPLMTLNEDELQGRWTKAGLNCEVSLGSYVYHYRAVSRGDAHKKGDWSRLPDTTTPRAA